MHPSQYSPSVKTMLIRALQVQIEGHVQSGNPLFLIDLLLSDKETQERYIRELARAATADMMKGIQEMQDVTATAVPDSGKSGIVITPLSPAPGQVPAAIQPPPPPPPVDSPATAAVSLTDQS